jgi:hypothetical protein
MKINPYFSYELNSILNSGLNEKEKISFFTTLITDKDRFLSQIQKMSKYIDNIEKDLGFKIPKEIDVYIVNTNKNINLSPPIIISYSHIPEIICLNLLKEMIKISINSRFPDENFRDNYIFYFIEYLIDNNYFKEIEFKKYLEDFKKSLNLKDIEKKPNFIDKNFKEHMDSLFEKFLY